MLNRVGQSKAVMAAALAASSLGAPAAAQQVSVNSQPFRVGIIDTPVDQIIGPKDQVTVQVKSFLDAGQKPGRPPNPLHISHGAIVASAFIQQAKKIDPERAIEIFSAQAFFQIPSKKTDWDDDNGPAPVGLNFDAATRSLDWFKQNGVRVVVTAFVGSDSPGMRSFLSHANALGMLVFAGANNDPMKGVLFPARDPESIAVTGNNLNLDFRFNRDMDKWVAFQADGSVPANGYHHDEVENGSSFAVGRAAAFGAYIIAHKPQASRSEIVEAMKASAEQGEHGVPDLSSWKVADRFRESVRVAFADPKPTPRAAADLQVGANRSAAVAALQTAASR